MSFRFRPDQGLIVVRVKVTGPEGFLLLRLALDTGASKTLIRSNLMASLGYNEELASERIDVTTATQAESAPIILVDQIEALGLVKSDFGVLSHPLPPTAPIDGLLGLDFLRDSVLTIDFHEGSLTLVR